MNEFETLLESASGVLWDLQEKARGDSTLSRISRNFRGDFRQLIRGVLKGYFSPEVFIGDSWRLIERLFWVAFERGTRDGGLVGISSSDWSAFNRDLSVEFKSLLKFGSDILRGLYNSQGGLTRALDRGDLYVSRLNYFYRLGVALAGATDMREWVLGRTQEHCDDCRRYHGQVHPYRTWALMGAIPGSHQLGCKGVNCGCILREVSGNERGLLTGPGGS